MYYLIYFVVISIQILIVIQYYDKNVSAVSGATRSFPVLLKDSANSSGYDHSKFSLSKYVVSLRNRDEGEYFGSSHFCGGSIISPNVILTAAHCLFRGTSKLSASSIVVAAKTPMRLKKTTKTQLISVAKVIVHQNYSTSKNVFDIALLQLKDKIVLDNITAAVIKLPLNEIAPDTECCIVGWGRLYMYGPLTNELLYANVSVHTPYMCKMFFPIFEVTHICASDFFDYEKHPCAGDSGGPLVCDGYLTGIISFGLPNSYGLPSVYTNAYKFLDWIIENSGKKLYSLSIKNFVQSLVFIKILNKFLYF